VRAYASVAYATTDKWKGEGKQRQLNVNAKGVVPLGSVTLDGTFSYSDRAEQDYQDLSLGQLNRLGYSADNFGPSQYALAVQVADIAANRGETGTTPLNPAAGAVYPRRSRLPMMPITTHRACAAIRWPRSGLSADLAPAVTLKARTYLHHNEGQGTWGSPYVNSPSGVPMALRTTDTRSTARVCSPASTPSWASTRSPSAAGMRTTISTRRAGSMAIPAAPRRAAIT